MSFQQTGGILLIISGAILLVVGIVFAQMVIDGVNKQGGKIGCFDSDDNLISNASGPEVNPATGAIAADASTTKVPKKVSKAYQGPNVVNETCGTGTAVWGSDGRISSGLTKTGTIQYTLEVYGADSMNGLFTMLYYIVLIAMSLSGMGGGGFLVATSGRRM